MNTIKELLEQLIKDYSSFTEERFENYAGICHYACRKYDLSLYGHDWVSNITTQLGRKSWHWVSQELPFQERVSKRIQIMQDILNGKYSIDLNQAP